MKVTLHDVTVQIGTHTLLRNVHLRAGEDVLLLIGHTGSGKSTLLQTIAGLTKVTHGTVQWAAEDADFGQGVGILFQYPEHHVFAPSVREDIEFTLRARKVHREQYQRRVDEALRIVDLDPAEFADRSPFLLSGGEKRRVALATILAAQPQTLLLDEPTAGLDPAGVARMIEHITRLRQEKGVGMIIATHDLDAFLPIANRVAILQGGQVSFAGTVDDLWSHPEHLTDAGIEWPAALRLRNWLTQDTDRPRWQAEDWLDMLEYLDPSRLQSTNAKTRQETDQYDTPAPATSHFWQRFDPRAKWLGLIFLSIVIFTQQHWTGLLFNIVVACLWMMLAPRVFREAIAGLRMFLPFLLVFWLISAIPLQSEFWMQGQWRNADWLTGTATLFTVRLGLLLLIGLYFAKAVSTSEMRAGIEAGLSPLGKLGVPVRVVAFTVAVTLQFVPWILQQIQIISLAARARGTLPVEKNSRKIGLFQWGRLLIPLLIGLLRIGDELATAVESRGFNGTGTPIRWADLRWQKRDWILLLVVMGIIMVNFGQSIVRNSPWEGYDWMHQIINDLGLAKMRTP